NRANTTTGGWSPICARSYLLNSGSDRFGALDFQASPTGSEVPGSQTHTYTVLALRAGSEVVIDSTSPHPLRNHSKASVNNFSLPGTHSGIVAEQPYSHERCCLERGAQRDCKVAPLNLADRGLAYAGALREFGDGPPALSSSQSDPAAQQRNSFLSDSGSRTSQTHINSIVRLKDINRKNFTCFATVQKSTGRAIDEQTERAPRPAIQPTNQHTQQPSSPVDTPPSGQQTVDDDEPHIAETDLPVAQTIDQTQNRPIETAPAHYDDTSLTR
ncbi:MAG: hypothetical protein OXQ29_28400, partial [Rhodospirillaceae bacterium]|nr:hypothetical protein [Rhodospirillaceae bacterium]